MKTSSLTAVLLALGVAFSSAACAAPSDGDDGVEDSDNAISGKPSAAAGPGWAALYEAAEPEDFVPAHCNGYPPGAVGVACAYMTLTKPVLSEWTVHRKVQNAPREEVTRAAVLEGTDQNNAERVYVLIPMAGEPGRATAVLAGTVVVGGRIKWDEKPSLPRR